MPALDRFHHAVRNALVKDGWTITHEPYVLTTKSRTLFVDLGAEFVLGAEKSTQKIAVEIKTFAGKSEVADLESAIGQFIVYRSTMRRHDPDRQLYLAVPQAALSGIFTEEVGLNLIEDGLVLLIGYDPTSEVITKWIP
ncbi:XisH family protein [Armatimonas rosea]|uniref:Putative oligopeptide transporter (OPT) family protein n=1 Tax=Armatimonas rosea TaxID=685828 RepID=A0A7W9SXD1_ARMRO|nr:XisH family protein [Armatimonas rosea]MBB6053668.1 putative oligopeptide transporter (OPT) family protein [Armatimonas rosea]